MRLLKPVRPRTHCPEPTRIWCGPFASVIVTLGVAEVKSKLRAVTPWLLAAAVYCASETWLAMGDVAAPAGKGKDSELSLSRSACCEPGFSGKASAWTAGSVENTMFIRLLVPLLLSVPLV